MSKIVIRPAKPADVINIYRMLSRSSEFPGMRLGQIVEPMAIQMILNLIQSGYVAVADLSGHVVGTIGFAAFVLPWSSETVLYSAWLAVQPHLYKSGVIHALVRSAVKHADKVDVKVHLQLSTTLLENLDEEALTTLNLKDRGKVFTFEKAAAVDDNELLASESGQEESELGADNESERAD